MSDNLILYGSTFSNVAGFKAKNTSNAQLTFIRPQGSLNISSNDTYDVSQYASAVVSVSGGSENNNFIITLSYNDNTEMWQPDCTWEELSAAYQAEKNIILTGVSGLGTALGDFSPNGDAYGYSVVFFDGDGNSQYWITELTYSFTSQGLSPTPSYTYYDTSDADAIASHVLEGDIFYTSTGQETGTAVARSSSALTVSGATVTAPAGYYAAAATKSVNAGSATTPNSTLTSNPSISISNSGLITAAVSGSTSITPTVSAGYVSTGTVGTVNVSGSSTYQLSTVASATITPTESQQTAVAANKYTLGAISVGAIPSTYVGSGISQRSSSNLTVSGATVTVPAGYYASQATKSVATGTLANPTATKGSVSNHSISVTPSVQVTGAGYLATTTKTGTAVSVSASELVSGSTTISANGTYDVTNLASAVVSLSFASISTGTSNPSGGSNGDIYIKVVS